MGAAAELTRGSDIQDPDLITVFLAKERHRTMGNRIIKGHHLRTSRLITQNFRIHDFFNTANLIIANSLIM